jgi:hypothetical protein
MLKPFKENGYQRYLRTVIWPWRNRRRWLSFIVALTPYALSLWLVDHLFEHTMIVRVIIMLVAVFLLLSWSYSSQCYRRYENYQTDLAIEAATQRTHEMFERMGIYTRNPSVDGKNVVKGEVIRTKDD